MNVCTKIMAKLCYLESNCNFHLLAHMKCMSHIIQLSLYALIIIESANLNDGQTCGVQDCVCKLATL